MRTQFWKSALLPLLAAVAMAGGCRTPDRTKCEPIPLLPRELDKVTLPAYRVEPPDILIIEALKGAPKPPYLIEVLDVLYVQLDKDFPNTPLTGLYNVDPSGSVDLGLAYGGTVQVSGQSLEQAKATIEQHLVNRVKITNPQIVVTLAQSRAPQRISGPHLVRQDGTVSLGRYGDVMVAGMTLPDVKRAIEAQLSNFLQDVEVTVDVQNYNSKKFYVILDGGGSGQQVITFPITGNDTVLDAISQANGLTPVSSADRIWVARPAPVGSQHQILPVDWKGISISADTKTNYQLMPGDRVYVAAQPLVKFDNMLGKIFAPVERIFGITLLGTGTVRQLEGNVGGFGGFGGGFGGF